MKTVILFVLAAVALGCGACAGQQYPDNVPTMSDPAVVKLVRIEDGKESGYCTAWKIGDNRMMTAGHCCDLEGSDVMKILGVQPKVSYTIKGDHAPEGQLVEILYDDDDHDVCVMTGRIKGAPIRFAAFDPQLGASVWTAGYPKMEYLISSGYWSGRTEENMAKASVAVYGGASGSPVMNSAGEAVGVLVAYYPPMSNLALLTPLEWMKVAVDMAR